MRRRRSRTTIHDTKKLAQEALAQTIVDLRSGETHDSNVTVADFTDPRSTVVLRDGGCPLQDAVRTPLTISRISG